MKYTILSLAVTVSLLNPTFLTAASSSWNVDSNGSWSKESNWSQNSGLNQIYPNGKTDVAIIPAFKLTAPRTISIDENYELNSLIIDTGYKTTFSGGQLTIYDCIEAKGVAPIDFKTNLQTVENLTIKNAKDFYMMGLLTGSGSLTKAGSGTLFLCNQNTYLGVTDFQSGILEAKASNVLSSKSSFYISNTRGVVLVLNSYDNTIANLNGGGSLGGNIDLGAAILTIGNDETGIYQGGIFGSGGIKKVGSGTLIFKNSDMMTYSGRTVIAEGCLKAIGDNAFSKQSSIFIQDKCGANLDINTFNITLPKVLGGGDMGGSILLNNGTLTIGDETSFTFAGSIKGEGKLEKVGKGCCKLTGTNTFKGKTVVKEGSLEVTGLMNSAIEIQKGSSFCGNAVIVSDVTNHGNVTLTNKDSPLVIHGNFTQGKDCKMDIKIASNKQEAIITTGKFIIEEGAILNFELPMGLSSGSVLKIITAGEGIQGTFAATNLPENVKANLTEKSIILEIE